MKRIDAKIEEYMKELESNDKAECGADGGKSAAQITEFAAIQSYNFWGPKEPISSVLPPKPAYFIVFYRV